LKFLYEKQRKVESVDEHRKKQSKQKLGSSQSNVA
jgi:nitrate/nitrite transport system ATP-binding protein